MDPIQDAIKLHFADLPAEVQQRVFSFGRVKEMQSVLAASHQLRGNFLDLIRHRARLIFHFIAGWSKSLPKELYKPEMKKLGSFAGPKELTPEAITLFLRQSELQLQEVLLRIEPAYLLNLADSLSKNRSSLYLTNKVDAICRGLLALKAQKEEEMQSFAFFQRQYILSHQNLSDKIAFELRCRMLWHQNLYSHVVHVANQIGDANREDKALRDQILNDASMHYLKEKSLHKALYFTAHIESESLKRNLCFRISLGYLERKQDAKASQFVQNAALEPATKNGLYQDLIGALLEDHAIERAFSMLPLIFEQRARDLTSKKMIDSLCLNPCLNLTLKKLAFQIIEQITHAQIQQEALLALASRISRDDFQEGYHLLEAMHPEDKKEVYFETFFSVFHQRMKGLEENKLALLALAAIPVRSRKNQGLVSFVSFLQFNAENYAEIEALCWRAIDQISVLALKDKALSSIVTNPSLVEVGQKNILQVLYQVVPEIFDIELRNNSTFEIAHRFILSRMQRVPLGSLEHVDGLDDQNPPHLAKTAYKILDLIEDEKVRDPWLKKLAFKCMKKRYLKSAFYLSDHIEDQEIKDRAFAHVAANSLQMEAISSQAIQRIQSSHWIQMAFNSLISRARSVVCIQKIAFLILRLQQQPLRDSLLLSLITKYQIQGSQEAFSRIALAIEDKQARNIFLLNQLFPFEARLQMEQTKKFLGLDFSPIEPDLTFVYHTYEDPENIEAICLQQFKYHMQKENYRNALAIPFRMHPGQKDAALQTLFQVFMEKEQYIEAFTAAYSVDEGAEELCDESLLKLCLALVSEGKRAAAENIALRIVDPIKRRQALARLALKERQKNLSNEKFNPF
ncbi:MAG: hypothetical protein K0S07_1614 [Chlamydiales bacterium]|jgi:hypothetical protein|nr:hypothetical protein [Chlamydiales bacterium]